MLVYICSIFCDLQDLRSIASLKNRNAWHSFRHHFDNCCINFWQCSLKMIAFCQNLAASWPSLGTSCFEFRQLLTNISHMLFCLHQNWIDSIFSHTDLHCIISMISTTYFSSILILGGLSHGLLHGISKNKQNKHNQANAMQIPRVISKLDDSRRCFI